MTALDCMRERLQGASDFSDDELLAVLMDLQELARDSAAQRPFVVAGSLLVEVADDIARQFNLAATIERRNAARDAIVSVTIDRMAETVCEPADALETLLVGSKAIGRDGLGSIAARALTIETVLLGGLLTELGRESLVGFVTPRVDHRFRGVGVLDREIARELWEIGREDGQPGVTGVPDARQIAAIIERYQEAIRRLQNGVGAWIRKTPGYILRLSHNPERLRQVGFDIWRAFIEPRLDRQLSFRGDDPEKTLRDAYDAIVTGAHLQIGGHATPASAGPMDLIARASDERMLQFSSADAWYSYHRRFGQGSLMEAVGGGLRHAARRVAVMQGLGPDPRSMFERKLRRICEAGNGAERAGRTVSSGQLRDHFAEIDGTAAAPGVRLAAIGQTWRAQRTLAMLGRSVVGSVTDVPLHAGRLRPWNRGLLDRYADELRLMVPAGPERRAAADLIHVAAQGMLGSIAARFSANDDRPGTASRLLRLYLRLNLHQWWDDAHRTGVSLMLSRRLAQQKEAGWDGLDEDTRRSLLNFGLGAAEWDICRHHAVRAGPDGTEFMVPDALHGIANETMAPLVGSDGQVSGVGELGDGLTVRLQAYLAGRGDALVSLPEGQARQQASSGTYPGTLMSEVTHLFWQFKQFPPVMRTRSIGRMHYTGAGGDLWLLAQVIVARTVLGYVALAGDDVSEHREPPDPVEPATWVRAFVHGGAAGIYADFIFDEARRIADDAGLAASEMNGRSSEDLDRLYGRIRSGEDGWTKLMRFVGPGAILQLLDSRTALDSLILLQVQEILSPGMVRNLGLQSMRPDDNRPPRMRSRPASQRGRRSAVP